MWSLILGKLNQRLILSNCQIDRDAPRMKGIPEEHEKRRSVFWELLNMDCRMVCTTRLSGQPRPLPIQIVNKNAHYYFPPLFLESFTWTTTLYTTGTC